MDYYERKFRGSGNTIKVCFYCIIGFVILLLLNFIFCSCGSWQKVVTVPEVHEQHHWHTDSVIQKDSVFQDRQTVIRELDSATMARYGIQLKAAERAWLVETNELRREIERLSAMSTDRDTVRDSIPKPYPVYIEKKLTWWEQVKIRTGDFIGILIIISLVILIITAVRRHRNSS